MSKRSFAALPSSSSLVVYSSDSRQLALIDDEVDSRGRQKKKRSRWSNDDTGKTFIPGMPTQLPPNLSPDQERIYIRMLKCNNYSFIVQLQVEDLTRRLKTGELGIQKNPEDRSPSPEPIYSNDGKRLNTREYRTRKRMEDDRHSLIQRLRELKPEYQVPTDYKPPQNRITDKVWIPQDDNPHINFVGLLIGPRGNTLKSLEKDTAAKIIIRGKGSVKDGKVGRRDGLPMPGEDEPLHAYITAPSTEAVQKAVRKIKEIIRQGIEVPESQNDLRKQQLRELALLNGTLREHEGLMKLRAMAEAQSIATNKIQCTICGGFGHIASDCRFDPTSQPELMNSNPLERAKMDSEYSALMAELGVGGARPLPLSTGTTATRTSTVRYLALKQPPPPGVPPPDDEDDASVITATSVTANGTTPVDTYAYSIPPPPPPPAIPLPPGPAPAQQWPSVYPPPVQYSSLPPPPPPPSTPYLAPPPTTQPTWHQPIAHNWSTPVAPVPHANASYAEYWAGYSTMPPPPGV